MKAHSFPWNKNRIVGIAVGTVLVSWAAFCTLCSFLFLVQIEADGQTIQKQCLFPLTVAEMLEKEHITAGAYDAVEPAPDVKLNEDTVITVTRAVQVHVTADGQTVDVNTVPVTQAEAVALAGITLSDKDFIEGETIFPVTDGQTIRVVRVTQDFYEEARELPFTTQRRPDETLERGINRTLQEGAVGSAVDTIAITYYDGQEIRRHVVSSEIQQEPRPCIIAEGSLTNVSRGGERLDFRQAMMVEASAYTYSGSRTATGRQPAVGLIAVDPSVIPMGTRLYIEGYGYATAADTGGAIRGNRVDLFFETSSQCLNWGRRTVKAYILD